jgi:hypothetical protein
VVRRAILAIQGEVTYAHVPNLDYTITRTVTLTLSESFF